MANIHDSGIANVHRFHNRVAISVGDGSTFYLTLNQALDIAECIEKCSVDITSCKFTHSSFGSHAIPIGGKES